MTKTYRGAMLTLISGISCILLTSTVALAASDMAFIPCASEGSTCLVGIGGKLVSFGASGQLVYKALPAGNFTCSVATFDGQDPAPGVVKTCSISPYSPVVTEGQTFMPWQYGGALSVHIAYGANGQFAYGKLDGFTTYTCDNSLFGEDPAPGIGKACYVALRGYGIKASEGSTLSGLSNTPVAYGANGHFAFQILTGTYQCNNSTFGDPMPGVSKSCYTLNEGGHYLVSEGQYFDVGGGDFAVIQYTSGLNGNVGQTSAFSGWCNNSTFGGDVAPGQVKSCWGSSYIR